MTESELNRVASELGIGLPKEYRDLMTARASTLKGFTHQIRGETWGWFDETLYLDASRVIDVNLVEREPDAGSGYHFPNWWQTFFLIGSNGGGDYFCLRLDGVLGVWMLGPDVGDGAELVFESLDEFVETEIALYYEDEGV